jgi:hypothetical protein
VRRYSIKNLVYTVSVLVLTVHMIYGDWPILQYIQQVGVSFDTVVRTPVLSAFLHIHTV